jgi:hypothetical protein
VFTQAIAHAIVDLDVVLEKDALAIYINADLGSIRNTHTTQTMHMHSHTTSQFHGCFQEGLWSGRLATGVEQDDVDLRWLCQPSHSRFSELPSP